MTSNDGPAPEFERISNAPPKPAPDAMREALAPFLQVAAAMKFYVPESMPDMTFPRPEFESKHADEPRCATLTIADFERLAAAAIAAPVPPPDGAKLDAICMEIERLRCVAGDVRLLHAAGRFKEYEGEPWLKRAASVDLLSDITGELRGLVPSSPGAAEPAGVIASDALAGLNQRLDSLLLTAADGSRFILSTKSASNIVGIVREWIRAKRTPPPPDDVRSALAKLLLSAKLLQQNSEGCAANHYGSDCETFGLPGWLAGTKKDIESAQAALRSAPVSAAPPVRDREAIAKTLWISRGGLPRLWDEFKSIAVKPSTELTRQTIQQCYTDADAILFLHVQSSAAVGVTREVIARLVDPSAFVLDKFGNWYPESMSRRGSAMATAGSILALFHAPDATVSEPVAWQIVDDNVCAEVSVTLQKGVAEIWKAAGANVRGLYTSPQDVGREAMVSAPRDQIAQAFLYETGQFDTPAKIAANPEHPLVRAAYTAADRLAVLVSARDAVIEETAPQYEFPYQRTFEAIAAAVSLYPSKDAALGINVSVQKFQDAFNNHRDQRAIRSLAQGARP